MNSTSISTSAPSVNTNTSNANPMRNETAGSIALFTPSSASSSQASSGSLNILC